jgi:hypothetical protein
MRIHKETKGTWSGINQGDRPINWPIDFITQPSDQFSGEEKSGLMAS